MINTSYGTWNNRVDEYTLTLEESVAGALDNYPGIDTQAVIDAYRDAIDAALPDSVQLCGDQFYGPAGCEMVDFEADGFPVDEDGALDIQAIVQAIDFWAIAERIDTTAVTA